MHALCSPGAHDLINVPLIIAVNNSVKECLESGSTRHNRLVWYSSVE